MNEQEYQRRTLQSQERTIERLGEVQKGLDQLEVTVSDLRTENKRLREALVACENAATDAIISQDVYRTREACQLVEKVAADALEGGAE